MSMSNRTFARLSLRAVATLAVLGALVAVSACATGMGSTTYSRGQVGQVSRLDAGTIVDARPALIEGTRSGVGATAGAVVGGALASEIGGGRAENVAAGVVGAVAGGLAGAAIEEGATRQPGTTYMIRLERNGEIVSITQADAQPLPVGASVWIEYGPRTRVTPRY